LAIRLFSLVVAHAAAAVVAGTSVSVFVQYTRFQPRLTCWYR
jgi:hypothetical protein